MNDSHPQQFRLGSLLRYREQIVETRQQELHTLEKRLLDEQAALIRIRLRMTEMHDAIMACQVSGALDCQDLVRKFDHLAAMKQWATQQAERVSDAQAQVDAQRERLRQAAQDKQMLEKLKERQAAEFKHEQARKEGQMLDEIGVGRHRSQRERAASTNSGRYGH